MSDHFTTLRRRDDGLVVADCPEHGIISDRPRRPSAQGFNVLIVEARAHDDMKHGIYRSTKQYRVALAVEAAEFRAAALPASLPWAPPARIARDVRETDG